MTKFKIEGYQIGILVIMILLISLGVILLLAPKESTPPSDTVDQPTDQPIDQPTGDSDTGLDAIVMIVVAFIPILIILMIIQYFIKYVMKSDWGEDTEKKGLVSRISKSLTKSKCHGTYDAANKKCSSCKDSEQCKKETADAVKRSKKGWYHE